MEKSICHIIKVSILVPLYNAEQYVVDTLESCINQTYKNIEVVVVDDGSKDNSLTVAREYAQTHPQIKVISQENGGGCKARNTALAHSTGDYIVYLDADDIISPDFIEEHLRLLKDEPYTTVATCKWDRFYNDLSDATFPERIVYHDYDCGLKLVEDLLNGGMFGVTCYMTSRKLIEEAGPWDERVLVNQDGEFFVRVLLRAGKIKFGPNSALYYRSADMNSTSRKKPTEKRGKSLLYSYEQELRFAQSMNLLTDKIAFGLAGCMQTVAYQYNAYPEIVDNAYRLIKSFYKRSVPASVGGKGFQMACNIFGFWNVLKLRHFLKS